jgi:FkbM family methyltransferase
VGTHEFDTTSFLLAVLPPDGVFVDVGANLGYFTVLASRRLTAGRVIAVEPSPTNLACLDQNLRVNGATNVTVVAQPLWSVAGKRLELRVVDRFNLGANSVVGLGPVDAIVESTTLDRVICANELDRIDVLKVDVEGAELEVLRGAERCLRDVRPRFVVFAFDSPSEQERGDAYAVLVSAGYVEIDPESREAIARQGGVARSLAFFSKGCRAVHASAAR